MSEHPSASSAMACPGAFSAPESHLFSIYLNTLGL